jgi:hypothetical protein
MQKFPDLCRDSLDFRRLQKINKYVAHRYGPFFLASHVSSTNIAIVWAA